MPIEWYKNPIEWLSNYDIEDVMIQYNNDNKYKYCFLGVFPIDFSEQDNFGRCLYSHICSIDINKYINKNIKYIKSFSHLFEGNNDVKNNFYYQLLTQDVLLLPNENMIKWINELILYLSDDLYIFNPVNSESNVQFITLSKIKEKYI